MGSPFLRREIAPYCQRIGAAFHNVLTTAVGGHMSAVAQVEALIEDLPEFFHIAAGAERDIDKIQCDDALIEAAVQNL